MMFDEDEAMALVTQPDLQAVGLRLAMTTNGQFRPLGCLHKVFDNLLPFTKH